MKNIVESDGPPLPPEHSTLRVPAGCRRSGAFSASPGATRGLEIGAAEQVEEFASKFELLLLAPGEREEANQREIGVGCAGTLNIRKLVAAANGEGRGRLECPRIEIAQQGPLISGQGRVASEIRAEAAAEGARGVGGLRDPDLLAALQRDNAGSLPPSEDPRQWAGVQMRAALAPRQVIHNRGYEVVGEVGLAQTAFQPQIVGSMGNIELKSSSL